MYPELRQWLRRCDADILCLQEMTRTPGLRGWTRFDDADRSLPQRASLFDDVTEHLPAHLGAFAASDVGPVTTSDSESHRQEFGIATFTSQHLSIQDRAVRFVHGDFVEHDVWPNDGRPRAAQAIRLCHDLSGRTIAVVHLHGLRDPMGKADTPARLAQARRLAEFVDEFRHADDFTIVCGDFNVLPESWTFTALAELGLTDLVGEVDTRTSRYAKPVRNANYMLVSNVDEVVSFSARAEPEVSDHRLLELELSLAPQPA